MSVRDPVWKVNDKSVPRPDVLLLYFLSVIALYCLFRFELREEYDVPY